MLAYWNEFVFKIILKSGEETRMWLRSVTLGASTVFKIVFFFFFLSWLVGKEVFTILCFGLYIHEKHFFLKPRKEKLKKM